MPFSKLKIALILLAISQSAFAVEGMIVKDPAGLMQSIYANINRTLEATKQFVVENSKLVAMGTAAEQEVESINNGFANTIARLDKGKEERQNLEQLERSQPAQDACSTLTVSAGLTDSACAQVDQTEKLSRDRARRYEVATGGGIFATNSCSDNYVPPAELQRRTAEIQAVMASLQLDQYKSNLRREQLLQNSLLNQVNEKQQ